MDARHLKRSFLILLATVTTTPAPVLAQDVFPVEGVWSPMLTTREHAAWLPADLLCGIMCSPFFYDRIRAAIEDPQNDGIPTSVLRQQVVASDRQRVAEALTESAQAEQNSQRPIESADCVVPGLFEAALAPLPVQIDVQSNRVVLRQEYWNIERVIPLGNISDSAGTSLTDFGQSAASFDGDTLVIETRNIPPMTLPFGVATGARATVVERYRPSPDGSRLEIRFTIDDPAILRSPQTLSSPRLRVPNAELTDYDSCSALE